MVIVPAGQRPIIRAAAERGLVHASNPFKLSWGMIAAAFLREN